MITVRQTPPSVTAPSTIAVADLEDTLATWFGAPVVLTSSGRAAIALALAEAGLNRYRHRVAMPPLMSACVLNAIVRHGFPVDAAAVDTADATLLYHQYGLPQIARPQGVVIEDICHAFFARPDSGARSWAGQTAVFSLPKFFSTTGSIGGLVVPDAARAQDLRARRDAFTPRSPEAIAQESAAFRAHDESTLELMYLSRLMNPRIADRELGGLPGSVADIAAVGRERQATIEAYLDAAGPAALPDGWAAMIVRCLPYFFPLSGPPEKIADAKRALTEAGIEADIYSIDVDRNMFAPRLARMLLIPAHHAVPKDAQEVILKTLRAIHR